MTENRIKLRRPLEAFAFEMEKVLRKNDHKTGWDELSYYHLLARLDQERDELLIAIHEARTAKEIQKECCDIANFAMMIFDKFDR